MNFRTGVYHGKPVFQNFFDFYSAAVASMPIAILLLLVLAAAALAGRFRPGTEAPEAVSPSARPLLAAALSFLVLPAVGYVAALLVTGFFTGYYFMISVFGVIVGLPLALSAITGRSRLAGLCLFAAIAFQGLFVTARGLSGSAAPRGLLDPRRKPRPQPIGGAAVRGDERSRVRAHPLAR